MKWPEYTRKLSPALSYASSLMLGQANEDTEAHLLSHTQLLKAGREKKKIIFFYVAKYLDGP